jgi:hypothetical protein
MTDKGMVFLQNCLESLEDVPDLHSEVCALPSDVDQAVNIKTEKFPDVQDGEHPVPMTFVGIKAEREVSDLPLVYLSDWPLQI